MSACPICGSPGSPGLFDFHCSNNACQNGSSSARTSTSLSEQRAGEAKVIECDGIEFIMRWIPPGSFLMGSPSNEAGRFVNEGPQHMVRLSVGFWMSETPVTRELWNAVMGFNFSRHPTLPVGYVSWDEAIEFCRLIKLHANYNYSRTFRLPTEAEWEYACRAGTTGPYNVDGMDIKGLAGDETKPVRGGVPNAWGLYDMHGNI